MSKYIYKLKPFEKNVKVELDLITQQKIFMN